MKIVLSTEEISLEIIKEATIKGGFDCAIEKVKTQKGEIEGVVLDIKESSDILYITQHLTPEQKKHINLNKVI